MSIDLLARMQHERDEARADSQSLHRRAQQAEAALARLMPEHEKLREMHKALAGARDRSETLTTAANQSLDVMAVRLAEVVGKVGQLTKERDDARAEVERLRSLLQQTLHNCKFWSNDFRDKIRDATKPLVTEEDE